MEESILLVVTGASRGFGKAIASIFCVEASTYLKIGRAHVILVARSAQNLEELGRQILQQHEKTSINVKLSCHAADLSALDQLDSHFESLFNEVEVSSFDRVIFINNHGSLGFLGPCAESPSVDDMRSSIDLNITSSLWLSSRFAKLVQESTSKKCKATLVNISSLLAVESFPTMGIYGAGKAARDHFHKTMAKEISPETLKILNYAPGPLETKMVNEIRTAPKLDETLREGFMNPVLLPEESAMKLIKLVLSSDYESGSHVDFYDLPAVDETNKS